MKYNDWLNDFIDLLESHDVYLSSYSKQDDNYFFELETWTPNNGDEIITLWGSNMISKSCSKIIDGYDGDEFIDEYVEMWLEAKRKGVSGVPNSKGLVDDAMWLESKVGELNKALSQFIKIKPFKMEMIEEKELV